MAFSACHTSERGGGYGAEMRGEINMRGKKVYYSVFNRPCRVSVTDERS